MNSHYSFNDNFAIFFINFIDINSMISLLEFSFYNKLLKVYNSIEKPYLLISMVSIPFTIIFSQIYNNSGFFSEWQ